MEFDFGQNAKVDSLDKVPSQFQGLYKANEDGTHSLDSDNPAVAGAVSAIQGLNMALRASRKEAKDLRNAKPEAPDFGALSEYGSTVEEIAAGVQAALEAKGKQPGVDVEKIKKDLAKEYAKSGEASTARIKALETKLQEVLIDNALTAEIVAAGGNAKLLLPFVRNQVKINETEGDFAPAVVDAAGDMRFSGVTGNSMTIKELVAETKANSEYGALFKSEAKPGGDTTPGAPSRTPQPKQRELSATEKISAGLKAGQHTKSGVGFAEDNR